MAEETATFGLKIDSDPEPAKEAAAALEKFRASIQKATENITAHRKSMSLLKGSSDEVKDAKEKLKAAIAAEQAALTRNNLSVLKLGGSYDKLSKQHKKNQDAFASARKAIDATGGPLKGLKDHFEGLKGVLGEVTTGWGLMAVAAVGVVAIISGAIVGFATLATKLGVFAVTSGDALRNLGLMREAVSGNAANGSAWGHQIDQLSLKLATSKDELNGLVVSLEKSLRGTRVSGAGMVDTFKAVASAGAAMGSDVGKQIEDILTRGKLTGRLGIGFKAPGISELQGTGITFKQVAQQLSKDLHVSLNDASAALATGRVTVDAGAKAIREVIENRFGDINAKKLLSLDGIFTKLSDNVRDWASDMAKEGGALEPILKGLKSLVDMTGLQTDSGQKLKKTVTEYSQVLADGLTRNLPMIKSMAGAFIDFAAFVVRATGAVLRFAMSDAGIFMMKVALGALVGAAVAAAVALAPLVGVALAVAAPFILGGIIIAEFIDIVRGLVAIDWGFLGDAISKGFGNAWASLKSSALSVGHSIVDGLGTGIRTAWDALKSGFTTMGHDIVEGLKNGLTAAWAGLKNAVTTMGSDIKSEFKRVLGIASPSRVFHGYGRMTGQGYAQGIEASSDRVEAATVEMVATPKSAPAPSTAVGGSITPTINVEFNITGTNAQETAQVLQSSSLMSELTHAIQTALRAQGVPTGEPAISGG